MVEEKKAKIKNAEAVNTKLAESKAKTSTKSITE